MLSSPVRSARSVDRFARQSEGRRRRNPVLQTRQERRSLASGQVAVEWRGVCKLISVCCVCLESSACPLNPSDSHSDAEGISAGAGDHVRHAKPLPFRFMTHSPQTANGVPLSFASAIFSHLLPPASVSLRARRSTSADRLLASRSYGGRKSDPLSTHSDSLRDCSCWRRTAKKCVSSS